MPRESIQTQQPSGVPDASGGHPFGGRHTVPTFFLSGPSRTLMASDEGSIIEGTLADREALLDEVDRALASRADGVVVGAVPFSNRAPVRLLAPTRVQRSGRWWVNPSAVENRSLGRATRAAHESGDRHFLGIVAQAVEDIRGGALHKVVLARVSDVTLAEPPNVAGLIETLHARNPHGFTFALTLEASQGVPGASPRVLVGASPELLLSKRHDRVVSAPLAGSIPRAKDAAEDAARAAALLRSSKDRHEHRLVVERIAQTLRPFFREMKQEPEPVVVATHSMWHLSTRIEGVLSDPTTSSLRLALALHPTPAVCGTPTDLARAFIERSEGFDRGFFTGTLGHVDASGDGDWIVTIRCAELEGAQARIFAGAGIVGSSQPELELAETDAKMQTMLEVLAPGTRGERREARG